MKLDVTTIMNSDVRPSSVYSCVQELDAILLQIRAPGVSEESLKSLVFSAVDIFGRLANNLKTLVFKSFRSLKRSEIREFSESHLTSIRAVEGLHYGKFTQAMTYIPYRMVVTYPQAVDLVANAYATANVINVLTAANRELAVVQTALMRGLTNIQAVMGDLAPERAQKIKEATAEMLRVINGVQVQEELDVIQKADEVANQVFQATRPSDSKLSIVVDVTGNEVEVVPFTKMFKSMEDLRVFRKDLLDMEVQLLQVNKVEELVQRLDAVAKTLHRTLETHGKIVPQSIVDTVAQYVRQVAVCVSYNGYANAIQMVLEHNHALTLRSYFNLV
jgi:hypothetical protein